MIKINTNSLNPSQLEFLRSKAGFSLFCGGYGSGKSVALTLKLMQLKGENGTLPGLLIAQGYGALYANLIDPMMSMLERLQCPAHLRPRVHGRGSGHDCLLYNDGTRIYLRSAERPQGYDGLTVAYLCGDEIRYWSKDAYDVAIARVRIKKATRIQRCFSSTPAMNWMSDEFNSGKKSRELIRCGTRENAGNLPEGYMAALSESYSTRMQRAVLDGIFTILEGAVFEDFDPNPETSPWFVDFNPTHASLQMKKVYLAADPGYRRSAWIWIVERGPLDWVVFDELMADQKSDTHCVDAINQRGWPIDEVWIDVAAGASQSFEGASTLVAMKGLKMRRQKSPRVLQGANREIAYGVDKLRVLLGGGEGHPIRIRFAKRLAQLERGQQRGIVKDLGSLRYPELKYGRPVTDQPLKDGVSDHSCDALRYWAVGRWLCEAPLRRRDPKLRDRGAPGWRFAA